MENQPEARSRSENTNTSAIRSQRGRIKEAQQMIERTRALLLENPKIKNIKAQNPIAFQAVIGRLDTLYVARMRFGRVVLPRHVRKANRLILVVATGTTIKNSLYFSSFDQEQLKAIEAASELWTFKHETEQLRQAARKSIVRSIRAILPLQIRRQNPVLQPPQMTQMIGLTGIMLRMSELNLSVFVDFPLPNQLTRVRPLLTLPFGDYDADALPAQLVYNLSLADSISLYPIVNDDPAEIDLRIDAMLSAIYIAANFEEALYSSGDAPYDYNKKYLHYSLIRTRFEQSGLEIEPKNYDAIKEILSTSGLLRVA